MRIYCKFLILLLVVGSVAQAGDWPHWRGPFFNGTTDEKNLPTDWSQTEGIAWSVDLPGSSAATPIIFKDRVFLSGVDSNKDVLLAMCFDRTSGKLLWQHEIAKGISRDNRSTFAASSPVTDGKIVVFFYANGDLVCFDNSGKRKWARNLHEDYGEFAFGWTFASSPTLFEERIIYPGYESRYRQEHLAPDPPEQSRSRIARGVYHTDSLLVRRQ
ncbi:MAG: outer membrane protein assembly factor BamB family protein [Planctomycetota bacterium]|jgi:outer membrane protein assembly factor BamB